MPFLLLLLLFLATVPARAERHGELWLLGGPVFTQGKLTAFTQQTAASPRLGDAREFGTGGTAGGRLEAWARRWGAGGELSYLELPVRGGWIKAWTASALLLLRPAPDWRWQPYAGLGPSFFVMEALADYRPPAADRLHKWDAGEWGDPSSLTFDLRLGMKGRLRGRLLGLVESRITYLPFDESWTPSGFFGPPRRHKVGLSAEAVPIVLQAGFGLEL